MLAPPIDEQTIIRDCVGSPLMVQIGFCKAAEMGYNRALRKQLARGAKKNGTNHQLDTAILLAAAQGQTDTVRLLLKWGVKFDRPSTDTWDFGTPMHAAAARGHANVVALLLKAGATKMLHDPNDDKSSSYDPRTWWRWRCGIEVTSVWEEAREYPAVMQVLKEHRARKNWATVRSPRNMKKIKTLSIYWFWLEQTARHLPEPDPEGFPFMQLE